MTRDTTDRASRPTDPAVDDIAPIAGIDGDAGVDADAEGHSMLTLELARTISSERLRDAEKASRDRARVNEGRPRREGGILKRLGRR